MFKNSAPTILIANGANLLGLKLSEILLEQGSNIIMLDEYNDSAVKMAKHFRKDKNFLFLEQDYFNENKEKIHKLNYTFVLLHENSNLNEKISTKEFINSSQFIDSIFEFTQFKKAKSVLVTSLHNFKNTSTTDKTAESYKFFDIQTHAEKIAHEYTNDLNLNNRIIRVGTIFGPGMEIDDTNIVVRMTREALTKDYISIVGDGLEFDYYVYSMDAVYGLVKAIFNEKTKGNTYFLAYEESISYAGIANKILSNEDINADSIKFLKSKHPNEPLFEQSFVPEHNLSEIGWQESIDIDAAIAKTVEYIREEVGIDKAYVKNDKPEEKRSFQSQYKDKDMNRNEKLPYGGRLHKQLDMDLDNVLVSEKADARQEDDDSVTVKVRGKGNNYSHQDKHFSPSLKKKIHSKFRIFVLLLLIVLIIAVYFIGVLPVINASNASNQQTKILSGINKDISTKNIESLKSDINNIVKSNDLDALESRLKSLQILSKVTRQAVTYQAYLKAFSAYQAYISGLQKITNSAEISSKIFTDGGITGNEDILTIQTLNQAKSNLQDSIDALKNTSIENFPANIKSELTKMTDNARSLIEVLN